MAIPETFDDYFEILSRLLALGIFLYAFEGMSLVIVNILLFLHNISSRRTNFIKDEERQICRYRICQHYEQQNVFIGYGVADTSVTDRLSKRKK